MENIKNQQTQATEEQATLNNIVYCLFQEWADELGEKGKESEEDKATIDYIMQKIHAEKEGRFHFLCRGFVGGLCKGVDLAERMDKAAETTETANKQKEAAKEICYKLQEQSPELGVMEATFNIVFSGVRERYNVTDEDANDLTEVYKRARELHQAHGFAQGIKWAADLLKANEIVAAELQKGGAAYV